MGPPLDNWLKFNAVKQINTMTSCVDNLDSIKNLKKRASSALKDVFGHDVYKSDVQENAVLAALKGLLLDLNRSYIPLYLSPNSVILLRCPFFSSYWVGILYPVIYSVTFKRDFDW